MARGSSEVARAALAWASTERRSRAASEATRASCSLARSEARISSTRRRWVTSARTPTMRRPLGAPGTVRPRTSSQRVSPRGVSIRKTTWCSPPETADRRASVRSSSRSSGCTSDRKRSTRISGSRRSSTSSRRPAQRSRSASRSHSQLSRPPARIDRSSRAWLARRASSLRSRAMATPSTFATSSRKLTSSSSKERSRTEWAASTPHGPLSLPPTTTVTPLRSPSRLLCSVYSKRRSSARSSATTGALVSTV